MEYLEILSNIIDLGLKQGALEKRCGFVSGKITELLRGRLVPNQEIVERTLMGLITLQEDLEKNMKQLEDLYDDESISKVYSVYEFTFPNGKRYYGMTINIKGRWQDGHAYDTQPVGKAIKEFGWENVEKKIIAEKLTKENAAMIEKSLIRSHDTDKPAFGYNINC